MCASTAKKAIEQRLLGLLSYYYYHLPIYAKSYINVVIGQVETTFGVNRFVALAGINVINVSGRVKGRNKIYFPL